MAPVSLLKSTNKHIRSLKKASLHFAGGFFLQTQPYINRYQTKFIIKNLDFFSKTGYTFLCQSNFDYDAKRKAE